MDKNLPKGQHFTNFNPNFGVYVFTYENNQQIFTKKIILSKNK